MLNRCSLALPWALMTNLDNLVRIPNSYRWRSTCRTSFMKDGRGKEVRKWLKSGGDAEQLPTIDRSSEGVDRSTNVPSANAREGEKGGKEREKVMGDGG